MLESKTSDSVSHKDKGIARGFQGDSENKTQCSKPLEQQHQINRREQGIMAKLTDQQKQFVDLYSVGRNATKAALGAGYSEASAHVMGPRLLAKPHIAKEINKRTAAASESSGIDQAYVINRLARVVEKCMQDEPVKDKDGQAIGVYTFNASGANSALKMLGDHVGAFDKAKTDHKALDIGRLNQSVIAGALRALAGQAGDNALDITPEPPAPKTLGHRS
jgi:phage terminase small subunit